MPTLKRAREALREQFGFTLANEYIAAILHQYRVKNGEQEPAPDVMLTQKQLRPLLQLMSELRLTFIRLNAQGRPVEVGFKLGAHYGR